MDAFEKKLRELYQQQKREDEKKIPAFGDFSTGPRPAKVVNHSLFYVRVAAAVVLVVTTCLIFYYGQRKPIKETGKIYPVNINQGLPTQSLLDNSGGGEYIWNWKAPSDQLLEDATKSIKTKL